MPIDPEQPKVEVIVPTPEGPETPNRPDLTSLTKSLAGPQAPTLAESSDRVATLPDAPSDLPTTKAGAPTTSKASPPALLPGQVAAGEPPALAPESALGVRTSLDLTRKLPVAGRSPPPPPPPGGEPSDALSLTTRIAPQGGAAPVGGASSLLAALASYVLPGSGAVPPAVLVLVLAQVAILLAMARPPRRAFTEALSLVATLGARAGHSPAVERPG